MGLLQIVWSRGVGRELSSVPEQVRRNGTEERPEWGASPAKPSKPLRTRAKRVVLLLGVRTEFLAGGISGFAVDLSALDFALAIFCARLATAPNLSPPPPPTHFPPPPPHVSLPRP